MPIDFNEVPATGRVPFVYVEFDASGAQRGAMAQPYSLLLIGQALAAGTAAAETLVRVGSAEAAVGLFGAGSMLAQMADAAFANCGLVDVWAIPLDDAGAGVAASGSFTFTGPATAAGTLSVMVGGRRYRVSVTAGDTETDVAAAVSAAIAADSDRVADASAAAGVLTLTARHAGEVGNAIDLRANPYDGDALPAGVGVTVAAMAGGSGNPDVSAAVTAMGDRKFQAIGHPYTDAANLSAIEAELADRWGPMRQIEGVAFTAAAGTFGELTTLGEGRNSPHSSILYATGSPSPLWEIAAAYAGTVARAGEADPARPFQTLALSGVLAPREADRMTRTERNSLLFSGISTFSVDAGDVVRIERSITTYRTTPSGAVSDAYLDVNTPLTLGYLRTDFRTYILGRYPRHKLADDGQPVAPGQKIITPKIGKAEAVARFEVWRELGLVENIDQFRAEVRCERNASDPNRLDWFLPPDLVNQFRVGAARIGFIL